MVDLVGRTLGEFLLREKLGAGGGGAIYRAEQPVLGRDVVIKILSRNSDADLKAEAARFLSEAQLASKLDHPFAAHIYAFGAEDEGVFWIAMELVKGTTLAALLEQRGPIPLARFVPLFERICEVVYSAHEQGIVHCDIKASNVMVVSRAGQLLPKLLDFGIATMHGSRKPSADPRTGEPGSGSGPIGTPHYMAPEQWLGLSQVGPQTDIYALGVLAYQCLTGKLPFNGPTPHSLARAHAQKPLPPLEGELPEGLYQTLSTATAKSQSARFPNALEFGRALRAGSGLAADEAPPELEEGLRMTLLTNAPQPIADAVSALDAAANERQATAAIGQIVETVTRYLGLLALASRARVGPGANEEAPRSRELFGQLRGGQLTPREWLELSQESCRPFASAREAYPIPELVDVLCGPKAAAEGSALHALGRLLAETPSESEPRQRIAERLGLLSRVLEGIGFLLDYPLVARRGDSWQWWMGAGGRNKRIQGSAQSSDVEDGQAALLDSAHSLALPLWPLAQVMAPSPGANEELFILSGEGRHGARLVSFPQGFERQDTGLWPWFGKRIYAQQDSQSEAARSAETPYLGLSSFRTTDASKYFGREVEAEEFANRLRKQHLLAVVGPSGAGKSSFVQAGVIPLVAAEWKTVIVRPGSGPVRTLVAELERAGVVQASLRLGEHPERLAAELGRCPEPILLVVDQFEELLTLCTDGDERIAYASALMALETAAPAVRVVLTMRDDFLIRIQQLGPLQRRLAPAIQLLGTPAKQDLLRIIAEPAQRAGYHFDDPSLPGEMVSAVLDQAGALALLSFTASKLWELRDRHFQTLTRKAYQSLGGVGGALAHHAESLLSQMAPEERRLLREAFRALVTADGTRAVLRRHELLDILGRERSGELVLERLIGERLLVASEQGGAEDHIEVIHEALLSSWPRLVQWQREDAENARFRDQLRAAARQWDERGRPRGVLWRREALAEYKLWRARYPGAITTTERAFAEASLREEARGKRRLQGALLAVFLVLSAGIVLLFKSNRRAEASEAEAKRRLAMSHFDQGRQLALGGRPIQALAYLVRAIEEGLWTPGLRYLVAHTAAKLDSQRLLLSGSGGRISSLAMSRDRKLLALGGSNGAVQVWDAVTGRAVQTWAERTTSVWHVAFDGTGRRVVGIGNAEFHVFDVSSSAELGSAREGNWADFTATGALVTIGHHDVVVWTGENFRETARWHFPLEIYGGALDPAGRRVAAFAGRDPARFGGGSPDVQVLDAETAKVLVVLVGHAKGVMDAAFSPDGMRLATASVDGTARIWDPGSGALLLTLSGHEGPVAAIAWSPNGKKVATAGDDGSVRVWDAATGAPERVLRGHEGVVGAVAFLDEGRLASGGADATVRVWDVASGVCAMVHYGHLQAITGLLPGPGLHQLATASADGSIRVWDADATLAHQLGEPDAKLARAVRVDDNTLITMDPKRGWVAWATAEGRPTQKLDALDESLKKGDVLFKFSPDLRRAVLITPPLSVIDLSNGARTEVDPGRVDDACWSPDGELFATTTADGTLGIRDGRQGFAVTRRLPAAGTKGTTRCVFSNDGQRVIAGNRDGSAAVWSLATGAAVPLVGHTAAVWSMAFSPDGTKALTGGYDERAILWDVASGRRLNTYEPRHGTIRSLMLSPEQDLVGILSVDYGLDIFEAAPPGQLLESIRDPTLLAFSFASRGRALLTVSPGGPARWDTTAEVRPPAEVVRIQRCRLPFVLEGENLVARERDTSSPECKELASAATRPGGDQAPR